MIRAWIKVACLIKTYLQRIGQIDHPDLNNVAIYSSPRSLVGLTPLARDRNNARNKHGRWSCCLDWLNSKLTCGRSRCPYIWKGNFTDYSIPKSWVRFLDSPVRMRESARELARSWSRQSNLNIMRGESNHLQRHCKRGVSWQFSALGGWSRIALRSIRELEEPESRRRCGLNHDAVVEPRSCENYRDPNDPLVRISRLETW